MGSSIWVILRPKTSLSPGGRTAATVFLPFDLGGAVARDHGEHAPDGPALDRRTGQRPRFGPDPGDDPGLPLAPDPRWPACLDHGYGAFAAATAAGGGGHPS